ncbi:glycosyltransferase [Candidatus Parcubacteria bacterium]|nr:glycosyltransferase [Patescibacteria group bacterium]MBU4309252.1 glycosyltransferase [Patescibacteria group bacterium]MBU4432481.1 glycosyltransferase [Patescibacteria group bacterium]MBU4577613.1 glycosyltransferase [Patescibacteria group bacterium]MCG2697300.1 glycosyltransferase [Candidatus Parcubacteria bacterium]
MTNTKKIKYMINSFFFQKQLFERYLDKEFDFDFTPRVTNVRLPAFLYVPLNMATIWFYYFFGKMKNYGIIHLNRAEAFLLFKKIPGQISIFEIHGFDIGVCGELYLKDLHSPTKQRLGLFLDKLIENKIKKNIQLADIFYCSTPDLVEPITKWCGRKPTWLPNPIDTSLFVPEGGVIKLEGEPACFLAARLHGDKKPEVAIDIFENTIKKHFSKATLHLIASGELTDLYKRKLNDSKTYFWHGYMSKEELAAKLRGADLVFGDFSIGALSLLPMQVMALRRPLVSFDNYETLKTSVAEMPGLAIKLLTDDKFKNDIVEKNYQYILNNHDSESVAKIHYNNLLNFKKI